MKIKFVAMFVAMFSFVGIGAAQQVTEDKILIVADQMREYSVDGRAQVLYDQNLCGDSPCTSVVEGPYGRLYVGSRNRLHQFLYRNYDGSYSESARSPHKMATPLGVLPLRTGKVWIGTEGDQIVSHEVSPWQQVTNSMKDNLPNRGGRSCHQFVEFRGDIFCIGEEKYANVVHSALWVMPYSNVLKGVDEDKVTTLWHQPKKPEETTGLAGIFRGLVYNPADQSLYVLVSLSSKGGADWKQFGQIYRVRTQRAGGNDNSLSLSHLEFIGEQRLDPEINQPMAAGPMGIYLVTQNLDERRDVILYPIIGAQDNWRVYLFDVPAGPIMVRKPIHFGKG